MHVAEDRDRIRQRWFLAVGDPETFLVPVREEQFHGPPLRARVDVSWRQHALAIPFVSGRSLADIEAAQFLDGLVGVLPAFVVFLLVLLAFEIEFPVDVILRELLS